MHGHVSDATCSGGWVDEDGVVQLKVGVDGVRADGSEVRGE